MVDVIEGEVREVDEPRALVIQQPGQAIISAESPTGPTDMLERATTIATALSKMVEAQKLYTVISGKKYPQVEAWMTIGRMDNVVAREVRTERHDPGYYEAHVELVRLSDGMVIGHASAICGMPDDKPWATRAEYARRSMAVTRATSRAFRQQYSWIMALAGYEPTPADEMPDQRQETHAPPDGGPVVIDGAVVGTVEVGRSGPVDLQLRQTPDGSLFGFKLKSGRKGYQAVALGDLADALAVAGIKAGDEATVWGVVESVPWQKDGKDMPPYSRILIDRVATAEWTLPAAEAGPVLPPDSALDAELDALPW